MDGLVATCAVRSHGLRGAPKSGMALRSTRSVSGAGCGISSPSASAWSAAMMPAPPEGVTMATPRAFGCGALAKRPAVSSSASKSSTSAMPARRKAADQAAALPASEPVWETAAAAPASPRPSFSTTTALPAARAASPSRKSRRASRSPSTASATLRHSGMESW